MLAPDLLDRLLSGAAQRRSESSGLAASRKNLEGRVRVTKKGLSLCCLLGSLWLFVAFLAVGTAAYGQAGIRDPEQLHTPKGTVVGKAPSASGAKEPVTTSKELAASSEEYVVGEADSLQISVWKEPELTRTVFVRPDGRISLPLVNEVPVSGLTTTQIQVLLKEKLEAFLTMPQVTVTVVEIRSKVVYITGEVARPGAYPILSRMTVMQLIAEAGGFTPFAHRNGILILRDAKGQQKRYKFSYNVVVRGQRPEQNITLQAADTVVVP